MGQSAGAMSIQTLICSDMLKGKVKGAVMLSGGGKRGAILPISKPNVAYWNKLVKASGAQSFAEFENLDAKTVWTTWKTKFPIGKALCTKPVIDGELVKDKRYDTDIPIVLGTVKKDLLPPVLNHMARAFARGQKKKKRALLRLFAYAPVAARRRLFPFLRPMVRARVARKISSSVHEGGLRVVRRNR